MVLDVFRHNQNKKTHPKNGYGQTEYRFIARENEVANPKP